MRTNIVLSDQLVQEAMRATGLKTKRAVVEAGLEMLVAVRRQADIRRLRGKIIWRGDLAAQREGRARAIGRGPAS